MKKLKLFLFACVGASIIFSGCNNDDDDPVIPDTGPTCTNLVTQEDIVYSGSSTGTEKRIYKYNSSKKLVKIEFYYNGSATVNKYDTIRYDANGIDSVNTYNVGGGVATETHDYTYTSGKLTSVIEKGNNGAAFTRTRTFTYNGSTGLLTDMDVVYTVGSNIDDGLDHINTIVFTNGNITSADLGAGMGGVATLTWDATAANPYKGLNNDSGDILALFGTNNVTTAYSNAAPLVPFFTNSYTYANGRVATITETDGTDTSVKTLTYTCL